MTSCTICGKAEDKCPHWFLANTNRPVRPQNLNHEDMDPYGIGKALSKICRFNGHTKHHYSVAQHSVYVANILPEELKFCGLMHDATEVFCCDLIRPIKITLPTYIELEMGIWEKLCERFRLPREMPKEVKWADNSVLMAERWQLLPKNDLPWGVPEFPADIEIKEMTDKEAYNFWATEWNRLAVTQTGMDTIPFW